MSNELTDFYLNYVDLCAQKKKSLSAVAEQIGLSRTSPNGWKKRKIPNDTTKAKLADYFGITVEQLMTRDKKESTDQKDSGLHVETAYDLLTPQNKEKIRIQIVSLLKQQSDS